ncbi:DUF1902 domain-containing protein [Acidisoma cellulosilytica]|uniref:DUF1902 domain-containing protein n=1 Tax=Acidisoma cellulosilyticum TaxID=2802395 RepID=A0A963YYM8_9PROT|nr:DUF1902 domain-containing protein [Acidisoma cellulosilyticum]MCB8879266.1 DUF1902 domain-containing protein [Acidisoma cellulosilyticum]
MYQIKAYWDADSRMWLGASDDLPNLSVQAPTMEDLIVDVRQRIQDVLPTDDHWRNHNDPISISFIASRSEQVQRRY